jgi:hypothetical protein
MIRDDRIITSYEVAAVAIIFKIAIAQTSTENLHDKRAQTSSESAALSEHFSFPRAS